VRLLVALTDTGAVLDRGSAGRLRLRADAVLAGPGEVGAAPWGWTGREPRTGSSRSSSAGDVALPALAELDEVGVWTAMLPEWAPLRGRAQRNPYHRYALDRHAWHAAAELGELVRREAWAAETLVDVDDREALLLGVLLHDVGKALGEPHSETGVPLAAAIARGWGPRPRRSRASRSWSVCTSSSPMRRSDAT
jgi:[protein-PII] uridylyltransferase